MTPDKDHKKNPRDPAGSRAISDRKPRLFLEKPPGSPPYSQEEFDEMVPAFMHRDFYRSQEGDFDAVQPSGRLEPMRQKRLQKEPPLQLGRTPSPRPVREAPTPAESKPVLTPLRGGSEPEDMPERDFEPGQSDTVVIPRQTSRANQNLPLVACLLFVVGVFLWREQTRPNLQDQAELPIPQAVVVVDEKVDPNASVLRSEGPYPEMSPEIVPATQSEPEETTVGSEMEPSEERSLLDEAAHTEPAMEPIPDSPVTLPARESSDQRAAILERMSEGTVSSGDRETRAGVDREAPAPPEDESLFPVIEEPAPQRPVPPVQANPVSEPTHPASSADLFPADVEVSVKPPKPAVQQPAVQAQPAPVSLPVKVPAKIPAQGEPYQIAEPDL